MLATRYRLVAVCAAVLVLSSLVPASPALASEEGRRNGTYALGALTAYLFTRGGNKVPAFLGLAATGYAYKRYQDAINDRHRRERYYRYYGWGYYRHYYRHHCGRRHHHRYSY